jgi:type IV secretion system protein VirD4
MLKPILNAQKGPLPGPDPKDKRLRTMRSKLMLATNKITELA